MNTANATSRGQSSESGRVEPALLEQILARPELRWGRLRWAVDAALAHTKLGDRVLDVGCGKGWLVDAYAKLGRQAEGVDVDPDAISASRQLCTTSAIHSYDGLLLPFEANRFRLASFIEALEHVSDERAVLAEIHRVLQPGGVLVLTTPHAGAWDWLDPDNFKFRVPWLHKLGYRALGRGGEYQERFEQRGQVLGNFTRRNDGERYWHRHYKPREVEAFASGFKTVACRREGGGVFAGALVANYVYEKFAGAWSDKLTELMRWDTRHDNGERAYALHMILVKE